MNTYRWTPLPRPSRHIDFHALSVFLTVDLTIDLSYIDHLPANNTVLQYCNTAVGSHWKRKPIDCLPSTHTAPFFFKIRSGGGKTQGETVFYLRWGLAAGFPALRRALNRRFSRNQWWRMALLLQYLCFMHGKESAFFLARLDLTRFCPIPGTYIYQVWNIYDTYYLIPGGIKNQLWLRRFDGVVIVDDQCIDNNLHRQNRVHGHENVPP